MRDPHAAKCDEIRPMLKDIDDGFDIDFDWEKERYYIHHKTSVFQTVPFGEVTRKLIADIRRVVWLNKTGQVLDHVERSERRAEARSDRATELWAEAMASDIRRPLLNDYLYGG